MKVAVVAGSAAVFALVVAAGPVVADDKALSAAEVKALFTNKTFDGHNEAKDKDFRVYAAPDGKHMVKYPNGKTREGTWRIDAQGNHCVTLKKETCGKLVSKGGGVYHKIADGTHIYTLKNFVDGNKL